MERAVMNLTFDVLSKSHFCNAYVMIIPNQITMYNLRIYALVYLLAVAYEDVFF